MPVALYEFSSFSAALKVTAHEGTTLRDKIYGRLTAVDG